MNKIKGSIRKRGDVYEYSFEAGKMLDENGNFKRKRISKSGFKTKKLCEIEMTKAIADFERTGLTAKEKNMSLAEYLYFYLDDYVKVNCRPNTLDLYKKTIDNYIIPKLGHVLLYNITPRDIKKLLDDLYKDGYSESTIKTTKHVLSKSFRLSVYVYEFIKTDPTAYMKLEYQFKDNEKEPLSLDEAKNILFYMQQEYKHSYFLMIALAFHTGCRRSEILATRFDKDSVDLENRVIHVKHQAQFKNGAIKLVEPKTKSSKRDIAISSQLYEILIEHQEYLKSINVNHNFVCVNTHGDILNNNTARHALSIIKKITGKNIGYHDFRRCHATLLCSKNCNPKSLQLRLGHSKISTSFDLYVKNTEEIKNEAALIWESVL